MDSVLLSKMEERTSEDIGGKIYQLIKELQSLFKKEKNWPERSREKWKEILEKSSFFYSLWNSDLLVGFGRCRSDGANCTYHDIVVHENYRGIGLGRKIMEKLEEYSAEQKFESVDLKIDPSKPELRKFYGGFDFKNDINAMLK